jgi:hypothetical protein
MRDARMAAVALAAVAAGCGGATVSPQAIKLTPSAGTESVMECLSQESAKLGYKVLRIDREDGLMEAERRDKNPDIDSPREYGGGDRIAVSRLKAEDGVRPLLITPSSFIVEWLVTGANQKKAKTSERVLADAQALSDRCRL